VKHQERKHNEGSPFAAFPVFPKPSDASRPENLGLGEMAGLAGGLLFRLLLAVAGILLAFILFYTLEQFIAFSHWST
jgi:hypothetical protein